MHRALLPPRPDLLGDKRQHRAKSRSSTDRRSPGWPGPTRPRRPRAVGARLHQLDVVVAERPEERLRDLEGPRVVVGLERGGGLVDDVGEAGQQRPVERLGDRGGRRSAAAPSPSTNLPTLRSFIASRRPTFICVSSKGMPPT